MEQRLTSRLSRLLTFDSSEAQLRFSALVSVVAGIFALALLARVVVPLPFTPVPITGQTFGVAFLSLTLGRKRGFAIVAGYLLLGAAGVPLFAPVGSSGSSVSLGSPISGLGPTSGYLIGMLFASYLMGSLADLGFTRTFLRTWIAALAGSAVTFVCGAFVLSKFVPSGTALALGVLPFLVGDVLKTLTASALSVRARRLAKQG